MDANGLTSCLNIRAAAERLGVSLSKMQEIVHSTGFPAIRFGRRIIIPVAALDQWLNEQAAQGLDEKKRRA